MASIKHYLLPADYCEDALQLYALAKEDALSSRQALLHNYCADAMVRAGPNVEALAWRGEPKYKSCHIGLCPARWDAKREAWIAKPNLSPQGQSLSAEMAETREMLEIWRWALERALGVYGSVFGHFNGTRSFINAVAQPLPSGQVLLFLPARDASDGPIRPEDPRPPRSAKEISGIRAKQLLDTTQIHTAYCGESTESKPFGSRNK